MIDFPHINKVAHFEIRPGQEKQDWDAVRDAACFLTEEGIETLRSGLDGHVKSILVEPFYICRDYRNLYSNYLSKKFRPRSTYCNRLHFFNREGISIAEVFAKPDGFAEHYLGFSVIQPIEGRGCLGRTFIDPMKVGNDPGSFYCLRTEYNASIMGADYHVKAFPYTAQSAEATVCAHSALWGVCRYLSERYNGYSEIFPYDLIQMTGSELGRTVPYRGMTYTDYLKILSSFGCHPIFIKPEFNRQSSWMDDRSSFYDIYSFVESGFPVLASLNGHVITLVGHTLRDEKPDEATMDSAKDSHGWVDSFHLVKEFVVVDDNFFPYQRLGFKGAEQYYCKDDYPSIDPCIENIYVAVVPLAEKVYLQVDKARKFAKDYLSKPNVQRQIKAILQEFELDGEPIITRLFLTSGSSFKRRKRDFWLTEGDEASAVAYHASTSYNLPHFIWVMELAPYSLWKSGKCISEVVIDSTISKMEKQAIYIRAGNVFFGGEQGKMTLQESSDGCTLKSKAFRMYTHNLGTR